MKTRVLCFLVLLTSSYGAAATPKMTLRQSLDFSRYFPLTGVTEYTLAVHIFGSALSEKEVVAAQESLAKLFSQKLRDSGVTIVRDMDVRSGKQAHIACYLSFAERWDPPPAVLTRGYTRTVVLEVTAPMTNPRSSMTKDMLVWKEDHQDAVGSNGGLPMIEAEGLLQKLAIDSLRANKNG